MNKQTIYFFLLINCILIRPSFCQEIKKATVSKKVSRLFASQDILPIQLTYSLKDIKKNTNDSTYIKSKIVFQEGEVWDSIKVQFRSRGNFRLKTCYFPPIKIKIKKSDAKGTVFKGNKNLKAVLPCLNEKDKNDNVIKEYLAYKFFETVSPYNFKTRLLQVEFEEIKNRKSKHYQLKGFLIEDDKELASRFKGKVIKTMTHPLAQDPTTAIRNAFFQFMIGNTDFSVGYQHNAKLIYIDNVIIPVPYDFDMAGLVNASYARVPDDQGEGKQIKTVTERKYRGFERELKDLQQIREEFIANKASIFKIMDEAEQLFEYPKNYSKAREFISDFYEIMEDDRKFNNEVVSQARTK